MHLHHLASSLVSQLLGAVLGAGLGVLIWKKWAARVHNGVTAPGMGYPVWSVLLVEMGLTCLLVLAIFLFLRSHHLMRWIPVMTWLLMAFLYRIFRSCKNQAWNQAGIITCRVNPKNTSRECARCGTRVIRYAQGQPEQGYQPGAPLMLCPACHFRNQADRNASLVIGQRLIARYHKGKPLAPLLAEREPKDSGVIGSQDVSEEKHPSCASVGHGAANGYGTTPKGKRRRMGTCSLSLSPPL